MTNKRMLVDVGRDVTYVTIINELESRNDISTKEIYSLNFKDLAEQVIDTYFKKGIELLYVDCVSFGKGLIDELTVLFKEQGLNYDHENGTVQPSTSRMSYEFIGEFEFVGKGAVVDNKTGKTFDAKLSFNADSSGIEFITTKTEGNSRNIQIKLNVCKRSDNSMWEIEVSDEVNK